MIHSCTAVFQRLKNLDMNEVTLLSRHCDPYVAKEDSLCLFIVAKETALNKQQAKPYVPLGQI